MVEFNGRQFTLNQCEGDLLEWLDKAKPGEYTRYYDRAVFKTETAVYAAYWNNLKNYWQI